MRYPVSPRTRLPVVWITIPIRVRIAVHIRLPLLLYRDRVTLSRSKVPQVVMTLRVSFRIAPKARRPVLLVPACAEVVHAVDVVVAYPSGDSLPLVVIAKITVLRPVGPIRPVWRCPVAITHVEVRTLTRQDILQSTEHERPFSFPSLVAWPYPCQPLMLVPFGKCRTCDLTSHPYDLSLERFEITISLVLTQSPSLLRVSGGVIRINCYGNGHLFLHGAPSCLIKQTGPQKTQKVTTNSTC